MTERAIDRMVEYAESWLDAGTEYSRGQIIEAMVNKARSLAQEEKAHKAEAPASLVEEIRILSTPSAPPNKSEEELLDDKSYAYLKGQQGVDEMWREKMADLFSRYRPVDDSALVGEIRAWCYMVKMPHKNDRDEAWYLSGYSDAKAKVQEIISKHDKGAK